MKLIPHQTQFSLDIAKLINKASEMNVGLTFGEAWRTIDQQLLYYYGLTVRPEDRVLQKIKKGTRTRTRTSNHGKRLAVDFNFIINGEPNYEHPKVAALGLFWESLHPLNRWGGHFTDFFDAGHFERNVDAFTKEVGADTEDVVGRLLRRVGNVGNVEKVKNVEKVADARGG